MFTKSQVAAFAKSARGAKYIAGAGAGLALTLAVGAAQGGKAEDPGAEQTYKPVQAMSYVLGSKRAIGHFSRSADTCEVILMVAEVVDPEVATPTSAARLRLNLIPGQVAGLDSEEGQSIDMTCGPRAETLNVRLHNWIDVSH